MSVEDPTVTTDTNSIEFEMSSPGCLTVAQTLLAAASANGGITRVSIEIESSEPFTTVPQTLSVTDASQPVGDDQSPVQTPSSSKEELPSQSATDVPIQDSTSADASSTAQSEAAEPTEDAASDADTQPDPQTPPTTTEPSPDPSPPASGSADDSSDNAEADEDADADESVLCDCGRTFPNEKSLYGHQRWCDGNEAEDETDETDTAESDAETDADTTRDESETDETITPSPDPSTYEITVGTWKYKVASTLAHTETPTTAAELAEQLEGTDWTNGKDYFSRLLRRLSEDGIVDRQEREREGQGTNPYEYWLTDAGATIVDAAEETARETDTPTYETLIQSTDASTTDADDDDNTASSATTSTPASGEQSEAGASGDEPTDDNPDAAPDVTIKPGTRKYKAAAALYHSSKPTTAKDLAERLGDTDWEQDRSNMSADLGELHDIGVVTREQRRGERGKPYEYELTDTGETVAEHAIEAAKADGSAQTYEEVIAGK